MKKSLSIVLILILFCALTQLGSAQNITGSAHDFSSSSWNTTGEICIVCHTTHNADVSMTDAPLWNHEISEATFDVYSSSSLNATTGQPDASSKLCLSCHDGTVASDNFGGETAGTNFVSGNQLIGTELTNDHPISFTYDAALATADGGLFDPTTTSSGMGGTIDQDLLIGNKMQCASCHDVHNSSGLDKLLLVDNAGSALCLTCHNK